MKNCNICGAIECHCDETPCYNCILNEILYPNHQHIVKDQSPWHISTNYHPLDIERIIKGEFKLDLSLRQLIPTFRPFYVNDVLYFEMIHSYKQIYFAPNLSEIQDTPDKNYQEVETFFDKKSEKKKELLYQFYSPYFDEFKEYLNQINKYFDEIENNVI